MTAPSTLATGGHVTQDYHGILIAFPTLRRTLSTGLCGGGLRNCRHLYNHRLTQFYHYEKDFPGGSVQSYLTLALLARGYAPTDTTAMITSATMEWHGYAVAHHRHLIVEAISTAGVEATASRAGDPAYYYEDHGTYTPVGTINTMISTNIAMPDHTLVKSLITATEAKAACLQDIGIASLTTGLPATGTATDGTMIATNATGIPHTDAGSHAVLGELISTVVYQSIHESLLGFDTPKNRFDELQTPAPIPHDRLLAALHKKENNEHQTPSR